MLSQYARLALVIACGSVPVVALAATEVVTETTTEVEKKDIKIFCSKKDEADAAAACHKWLEVQKASLGGRLLTQHCGSANLSDQDCLYKAQGEIKYVLKEVVKETRR